MQAHMYAGMSVQWYFVQPYVWQWLVCFRDGTMCIGTLCNGLTFFCDVLALCVPIHCAPALCMMALGYYVVALWLLEPCAPLLCALALCMKAWFSFCGGTFFLPLHAPLLCMLAFCVLTLCMMTLVYFVVAFCALTLFAPLVCALALSAATLSVLAFCAWYLVCDGYFFVLCWYCVCQHFVLLHE
jgi:hypothetical protein